MVGLASLMYKHDEPIGNDEMSYGLRLHDGIACIEGRQHKVCNSVDLRTPVAIELC